MLKTRIKTWRLFKYNRKQDVRAALQLASQQSKGDGGSVTRFQIGNRLVAPEEVRRYLYRKRIKDPARWASEHHTIGRGDSPDFRLGCSNLIDIERHAGLTIPRAPADPPAYLFPAKALWATSAFLHASMHGKSEIRIWKSLAGGQKMFQAVIFDEAMSAGHNLLTFGQTEKAFKQFDKAFEEIPKVLRDRVGPLTLIKLLWYASWFGDLGRQEFVSSLLTYVSLMAATIVGSQHPVHVVTDSILRSSQNNWQGLFQSFRRTSAVSIGDFLRTAGLQNHPRRAMYPYELSCAALLGEADVWQATFDMTVPCPYSPTSEPCDTILDRFDPSLYQSIYTSQCDGCE